MKTEFTLFTTHCPKCRVLEQKLQSKNLNFDICENTDEMAKLGITSVPVLKINDTGEMLDFYSAVKKVNSL